MRNFSFEYFQLVCIIRILTSSKLRDTKWHPRKSSSDEPVTEYETARQLADIDYETEFTPYQRMTQQHIDTVPPGVGKIPTTQARGCSFSASNK